MTKKVFRLSERPFFYTIRSILLTIGIELGPKRMIYEFSNRSIDPTCKQIGLSASNGVVSASKGLPSASKGSPSASNRSTSASKSIKVQIHFENCLIAFPACFALTLPSIECFISRIGKENIQSNKLGEVLNVWVAK